MTCEATAIDHRAIDAHPTRLRSAGRPCNVSRKCQFLTEKALPELTIDIDESSARSVPD